MTAVAIPTVEQYRSHFQAKDWGGVNDLVDELTLKCAEPAWDAKRKLAGVFTTDEVGVWYEPVQGAYVVQPADPTAPHAIRDFHLVKSALEEAGTVLPPMLPVSATGTGRYVKVAYSPLVRGVGERLNFLPDTSGIPNYPRPLAAALTSGLVGAGLGYAGGRVTEWLFPKLKRRRLSRNLALLGGGLGTLPGLFMMHANVRAGRPWNDQSLLNFKPGDQPQTPLYEKLPAADASIAALADELRGGAELGSAYKAACESVAKAFADREQAMIKAAVGGAGSFGGPPVPQRGPDVMAVNVDALGRTLWETGASPGTAAMTMGAMHAAKQMPGGAGHQWVTPVQMGQLSANMGAGYASGAVVGKALGALTGLPQPAQDVLKQTGMYLGIVKAVVPKLFGQ